MKKLPIILVFLFSRITLFAQGEANIWYFGNHAGLDFNSGIPVPIYNGALNTNEGCASISSTSGVLQFYTDGITVWNRNHLPMPNGVGLFGDPSSTQSGVIVPEPGNSHSYYIFTCDAQAGILGVNYSKVDMTLNGGLGNVTVLNSPLLNQGCEKITAVGHSNGIDYWVLVHGWLNNSYYAYQVTSTGVLAPVITNIGSYMGNVSDESIGYLKTSPNGLRVASCSSRGVDNCQIFDFDPSTGVLSNTITIQYPSYDGPYGVSFSPNNNVLYVSTEGGKTLYQYDLTSGVEATIIASEYILSTGTYVFALQLAVDNKIYVAPYGGNLHVINNPNVLGAGCNYVTNAITLSPGSATLGLPNFIQSYLIAPSITYINTCFNDTSNFVLTDTTLIDSVFWSFNDSLSGVNDTSSLLFPSHIFSSNGTYSVSAITYRGSIIDTISVEISITNGPEINIGNDTTFCSGFTIVLDAGAGFTSYLWQNSSISQSISVSTPGTYYATVSNICGTNTDTIHISTATPVTMSVNNPILCTGDTATLTASGATTYAWNIGSTANPLIVNPTTTTSYTVTGTDTNGCTASIVSTVTINSLPNSNAGLDDNLCAGDSIQLNASGGVLYSWSPQTGLSNPLISNPIFSASSTTNYIVTVTNANNCSSTDSVLITVYPNPNVNFSVPTLCVNKPAQFTDLSSGGGNGINWNFGDGGTSNLVNPTHTYDSTGNYTVTLTATGAGACSSTLSIPVVVNPLPVTPSLSGNSPICAGDEIQLVATYIGADISYMWTGPNSYSSTFQNLQILNATLAMTGTYNLFVTNNTTGCVSEIASIGIIVNNSPALPDIEATKQLCYGDTLQLTTTSIEETYLWNGPNAYTSNLQNPVIPDVTENNFGVYTLIVSNSFACTSQDTVNVFVDCEDITDFFVPNVFTPNGDNVNSMFKIEAANLKEVNVEIYDRWGINLFSWNSLQGGWDGKTKKGLEAPSGTYFYIINATTWHGKLLSKKGFFSLFR